MTILQLVLVPQPLLRDQSIAVDMIDASIKELAADMLETMYNSGGVGLAAVQIGVLKRLIVIDLARKDEEKSPLVMVNPEFMATSAQRATFREGCLSIPGVMEDVERPTGVTVSYIDLYGVQQTLEAEGILATCVQHEIDHLNGVLFTDHVDMW
ncbi:peptide deformylase [Pararhizobium qamdonense]|uniref:peptide deformylase n=1 Tax=Pararhizobium qamdonense TaxID=3031126 RepID=UPI0023E139C9|nr:peptide deformylase [Pararhizobium qamdonense]